MITCFHFVRLVDPSSRTAVLRALRSAAPDAVVSLPADAHAEAAWCLSLHQPVVDAAEAGSLAEAVRAALGDHAKVHKSWCMRAPA